jgi:hypothetical protein
MVGTVRAISAASIRSQPHGPLTNVKFSRRECSADLNQECMRILRRRITGISLMCPILSNLICFPRSSSRVRQTELRIPTRKFTSLPLSWVAETTHLSSLRYESPPWDIKNMRTRGMDYDPQSTQSPDIRSACRRP